MGRQRADKKFEQVYAALRRQIAEGEFLPGQRLPPERQLVEEYGVSRSTITRALNDLASDGLIQRRIGSGSYVIDAFDESPAEDLTLGLLVPALGKGEIFEPICARIASRSERENYSLLWSHFEDAEEGRLKEEVVRTAERYVERQVDGVFFEPVELFPRAEEINNAVVEVLASAGIPVVLLDGDYLPFPERSRYDIVGIDNIRAAYVATKHLLDQGARRVDFVWRPFTATTYQRRLVGYRAALAGAGIWPRSDWEHVVHPDDDEALKVITESGARNIVCVNDESAALLMRQLDRLNFRVPEDVRLVGFDDVKYARLVRVPLTTLRQPCQDLGDLAVQGMVSRLRFPEQPARDLLLQADLVVRSSSIIPPTG